MDLNCSFCGRKEQDVGFLIAGPHPHFICDECVEMAQGVINEQKDKRIFNLKVRVSELEDAVSKDIIKLQQRLYELENKSFYQKLKACLCIK